MQNGDTCNSMVLFILNPKKTLSKVNAQMGQSKWSLNYKPEASSASLSRVCIPSGAGSVPVPAIGAPKLCVLHSSTRLWPVHTHAASGYNYNYPILVNNSFWALSLLYGFSYSKVSLHITFFSACPLVPTLLNVFFLLSSEYQRENESVTHSVHYSHHQQCHNAKFQWW